MEATYFHICRAGFDQFPLRGGYDMSERNKAFLFGSLVTVACILVPRAIKGTRYIHEIYGLPLTTAVLTFIFMLSLLLRSQSRGDSKPPSILARVTVWTLLIGAFATVFGGFLLIGPMTRPEIGCVFLLFVGLPAMILGIERRSDQ